MFYACLSILLLFVIMCFCVSLAIIDLDVYNFGLYIVLLCIVGTMLACALCIANPGACPNPVWYTTFCLMLNEYVQEMYPLPDGASSPKMNGLRSRMMAMQGASMASQSQNQTHPSQSGEQSTRLPLRQESRATVAMLAPAVHIMHQVWRGMAWVTDAVEEDDDDPTQSYDRVEQGTASNTSEAFKRLSTIAESSCSIVREMEEMSSSYNSKNDITL
ncbi:unnamed protein product, partial [Mesorhabditis belari]|uniref:Uncharacterized protein n=1 Tax=Mesorhabditis belari TaxID=2138241 RepID=A0AAF3EV87_9BILA